MARSAALRAAGIWPTMTLFGRGHRRRVQLAAAALRRPSRPRERLGRPVHCGNFGPDHAADPALARPLGSGGDCSVLFSGLVNGGALALYCASMLLTDVVRTLLLFYVAPMWGALLGRFVLGARLTPSRILAIGSASQACS